MNGSGFGTSPTVQVNSTGPNGPPDTNVSFDAPVACVGYATDTCFTVNATVASADPGGPYNLTVTSQGYGGSGFFSGGSGDTPSSTFGINITTPPPPTISLASGGQTVAAGSTVYIDPTPSLSLVASLVPDRQGVNLTGNASWKIDTYYTAQNTNQFDCELTATTSANGTWDIGAAFGGRFCGGSAVVSATYQGYTATFSFTILGGQNPTAAAVKSALGSTPWFIQQLAAWESSGRNSPGPYSQFQTNGQPIYGPPNGFGVMQLDYNPIPTDLWTWNENVSDGLSLNTSNGSWASGYWSDQVAAWTAYNSTHSPTAMQQDVQEGPCMFSYTPSGGNSHPFSDALWIKAYNSGYTSPFITFNDDGTWTVVDSTNGNYVNNVCSQNP